MYDRIAKLPLLVILMGIGVLAMIVPGLHGLVVGAHYEGRVFLYGALLFGFLTSFMGLAMAGRPRGSHPSRHLLALLGLFVILPLMLAVPFHQAVRNTTFLNAYVEMVSALTTTGATLFDDPGRLPDTVHLWRALVGWMGGLFIWVAAIAILAPMALGGFEVRARRFWGGEDQGRALSQITHVADLSQRIRVYGAQLLPLYVGLTAILWLGLVLAGDAPFVALCHAMSTLSTSGISPVGGLAGGLAPGTSPEEVLTAAGAGQGAGLGGEVMIALFLGFAISRLTFTRDGMSTDLTSLWADPEVRLAATIVLGVPAFLFARHWLGAYEVDEEMNLLAGLASAWGSVFTVLSFLTTTGFESQAWAASQTWSGLETPGLILMGLALVGGGVATTAGGAKLLRVYALYKHGMREMDKLVHPSSVGGHGGEARHLRGRGAYMAWVFFMLMTLSVAGVMVLFSLTGEGFESAMVLTIAALTTTGPLADIAAVDPISYADLSSPAKVILAGAMVLGRLETLAIVALLNPETWRG